MGTRYTEHFFCGALFLTLLYLKTWLVLLSVWTIFHNISFHSDVTMEIFKAKKVAKMTELRTRIWLLLFARSFTIVASVSVVLRTYSLMNTTKLTQWSDAKSVIAAAGRTHIYRWVRWSMVTNCSENLRMFDLPSCKMYIARFIIVVKVVQYQKSKQYYFFKVKNWSSLYFWFSFELLWPLIPIS